MMTTEEFWNAFLEETGKPKDTSYIECFHFDMTEEWADKLLELVLAGKKRATASSLLAYGKNGMDVPRPGDYSIVTDWAGNPRCVIETVAVTILPFRDVTFDLCSREGENDTLAAWQEGHTRFFTAEGAELGYQFSEEMPVVFEDFAVVFPR